MLQLPGEGGLLAQRPTDAQVARGLPLLLGILDMGLGGLFVR